MKRCTPTDCPDYERWGPQVPDKGRCHYHEHKPVPESRWFSVCEGQRCCFENEQPSLFGEEHE